MPSRPLHPGVQAMLEYGPIAAFLLTYLLFRDDTFTIWGRPYTGFVVVTAAFVPVFLVALAGLWALTGRVARIQAAMAVLLVLFGVVSVWLNDPRVFKMKPTVIYLMLGLILWVGLLRKKSWLKLIMEEIIPLKKRGWRILTKRVTVLCFAAAAANEIVWRTQSETVWVFFETLVMPAIVLVFALCQVRLFVEYAKFKSGKKTG